MTKNDNDRKRVHMTISGKVQGVFFRDTTRRTANDLGVTGWVKNLSDGRVEAVAEGPENAVDKLVEFAHEGPARANVKNVEVEEETPTDEFSDFSIRY